MPTDEDLLYEEELLRNPYSLRMWQRYIEARRSIDAKRRYILYERALRVLPGSYKVSISFPWAHSLGPNLLVVHMPRPQSCVYLPFQAKCVHVHRRMTLQ